LYQLVRTELFVLRHTADKSKLFRISKSRTQKASEWQSYCLNHRSVGRQADLDDYWISLIFIYPSKINFVFQLQTRGNVRGFYSLLFIQGATQTAQVRVINII